MTFNVAIDVFFGLNSRNYNYLKLELQLTLPNTRCFVV